MPLLKLPESFGLAETKSWYFNTKENKSDLGYNYMSFSERHAFFAWYEDGITQCSITNECWDSTAKITSLCCGRLARFSAVASRKSAKQTFFRRD
jgi:hypothetical protein